MCVLHIVHEDNVVYVGLSSVILYLYFILKLLDLEVAFAFAYLSPVVARLLLLNNDTLWSVDYCVTYMITYSSRYVTSMSTCPVSDCSRLEDVSLNCRPIYVTHVNE